MYEQGIKELNSKIPLLNLPIFRKLLDLQSSEVYMRENLGQFKREM